VSKQLYYCFLIYTANSAISPFKSQLNNQPFKNNFWVQPICA